MKTNLIGLACLLSFINTVYAQTEWTEADYKRTHCERYAKTAVEQNQKNKELACDFTGSRWSDDEKGQYEWCLTVGDHITIGEQLTRKDELGKCLAKQADPESPANQIDVPAACRVAGHTPVRKIYSLFRYDAEIKSPVDEGEIRHDFNGDSINDHAYLEYFQKTFSSSPKPSPYARLTFCLSDGQTWKHYPTKLDMPASKESGLGSYDYGIYLKDNQLTISTNYFEHNAGSSFAETAYAFDASNGVFKVTNHEGEAYPVEMDGMTYPMSIPEAPDLSPAK